jgi:hypothetical protein
MQIFSLLVECSQLWEYGMNFLNHTLKHVHMQNIQLLGQFWACSSNGVDREGVPAVRRAVRDLLVLLLHHGADPFDMQLKYGGDLFDTKAFGLGVFELVKEKREEVTRNDYGSRNREKVTVVDNSEPLVDRSSERCPSGGDFALVFFEQANSEIHDRQLGKDEVGFIINLSWLLHTQSSNARAKLCCSDSWWGRGG